MKQHDKLGPADADGFHLINLRFQTAGKQPGKRLQIPFILHLRADLIPEIAAIMTYCLAGKIIGDLALAAFVQQITDGCRAFFSNGAQRQGHLIV